MDLFFIPIADEKKFEISKFGLVRHWYMLKRKEYLPDHHYQQWNRALSIRLGES